MGDVNGGDNGDAYDSVIARSELIVLCYSGFSILCMRFHCPQCAANRTSKIFLKPNVYRIIITIATAAGCGRGVGVDVGGGGGGGGGNGGGNGDDVETPNKTTLLTRKLYNHRTFHRSAGNDFDDDVTKLEI